MKISQCSRGNVYLT